MVSRKSLDEYELIATLLRDVHSSHGVVFNHRSLRLTTAKLKKRYDLEGIGFLTKTLPRLGKALDKALSFDTPLSANKLGFKSLPNSELPMFLGEFFSRVLDNTGTVLLNPCADSIIILRQILYLFYKYELPYEERLEQAVIDQFEQTEVDIINKSCHLRTIGLRMQNSYGTRRRAPQETLHSPNGESVVRLIPSAIAREARILLSRVFSSFDPSDITPRHGPGAVSTKEQLWNKYLWTNVPDRITDKYPFDAYFCASPGHVCDKYKEFNTLGTKENSARVILVPKDSRGPRLISCEPLEFQYVQQGLGRAIVRHVEEHHITKYNVFFTDQGPNQRGALIGSSSGKYATLDLKEASDRVSLDLVRLLFPEPLLGYLEACRSLSTELPSGKIVKLHKFAPMGSALCFPIMALTVWSLLSAGAPDADTRDSILVYGDDVIVPTAYAANAIERLELFGLKVNRNKSCIKGFFRESCGVDAFKGINVTPTRLRTVWSSSRCPESYSSWISYANSFYSKHYYETYDYIVGHLHSLYGDIPDVSQNLSVPSLSVVARKLQSRKTRVNRDLQKIETNVWDIVPVKIKKTIDGWSMLLRYFTEGGKTQTVDDLLSSTRGSHITRKTIDMGTEMSFRVSQYTKRRASMLVRRWR